MSYSTEFNGSFKLNKKATKKIATLIKALFNDGGEGQGVKGLLPADVVIPEDQPWCPWQLSEDMRHLKMPEEAYEWNHNYFYKEWLCALIQGVFVPAGYSSDGEVEWRGEMSDDAGKIILKDNRLSLMCYEPSDDDDDGEYYGEYVESWKAGHIQLILDQNSWLDDYLSEHKILSAVSR